MKIKFAITAALIASLIVSCSDSVAPEITNIDVTAFTAFTLSAENFSVKNNYYSYSSSEDKKWEAIETLSYNEILGETIDSVNHLPFQIQYVKYEKSWDTTRREYLDIDIDSTKNSIRYLGFTSYFGYSRIIGYHNSSTSGNSTFSLFLWNVPYKIVNDTLIIDITGTIIAQYYYVISFGYGTSTTINDLPTGSSHTSGSGYYSKEQQYLLDNSSFKLKLYKK